MSDSLPQGVELTSLDETFRNDPYTLLERLREAAPVHEDTQLKRFICTRHDDVKNLLRDKDLFTDPRKANAGSFAREFLIRDNEEPSMLFMDEPDHRRLRSLVTKPFTPAAVESWRPRIRAVIRRILDDIDSAEFDLIEHFAGPVPAIVIAEMLGIDPHMHGQFKRWSSLAVKVSFNPFPSEEDLQAGRAAMNQLESFFRTEIESRRAALGSDLISDMIRAEEAGEKLSVEEIVGQCNLLLVAGNVTTSDLIGNSIKALLDNPDQLTRLRERPDLIQNTVEEALRFDSPVTNSGRIANRDFELAGCPIKKGESLMTSLAAANRDPAVYPHPNKFDIEREDTHHQSFGGGRHLCLGAHLARLEVQEAILALLDRYPNLSHSEKGYAYASIPSFRGLSFFWVSR
ncbi:MAG: cytochrome P450 [Proteobacteria bacterium]|nr:cytochrome P450 [Pseudomonadota bacterium]